MNNAESLYVCHRPDGLEDFIQSGLIPNHVCHRPDGLEETASTEQIFSCVCHRPDGLEVSTKVAAGSSSKELAAAIAKDLQNANFDEYLEPLKILGFKPTKVNKTPLSAKQSENKGGSTNDTPPDKKSPFNLNEKHYQMYLKKGGTKSRDDIVRIAMDEDTTTLHVMNSDGVGNIFAM